MSGHLLLKIGARPGNRRQGLVLTPWGAIPCVLGRAGINRAKREGDGATPAGQMRPLSLLFRADRLSRPRTALPTRTISPNDGWCDDPTDRNYNRPVSLPYPGRHERLWRDDHLYDLLLILDWNNEPAIAGRGSAIFMHLARPDGRPTEGCVALKEQSLRRLLGRLGPQTLFRIG